jgi:hypothetical protein
MFCLRYFCNEYFAPRYFPKVGAAPTPGTGGIMMVSAWFQGILVGGRIGP